MTEQDEMVLCRTPTPGKKGTRIPRWKYDLVRKAILRVLTPQTAGVPFKDLPSLVENQLSKEDQERLGSISWYTTTVKLDLEVRGEIERIPDLTPQRLRHRK